MIITISLVNFHHLIKLTDFLLWWKILRPTLLAAYSSAMQCYQLYSDTLHPQDLLYNWKFVPFHHLLLSPPITTSSDYYQSVLCIYEFWIFIYFLLIVFDVGVPFYSKSTFLNKLPPSQIRWHIETVLISTYVIGLLCYFFGLRRYWGLHLEK